MIIFEESKNSVKLLTEMETPTSIFCSSFIFFSFCNWRSLSRESNEKGHISTVFASGSWGLKGTPKCARGWTLLINTGSSSYKKKHSLETRLLTLISSEWRVGRHYITEVINYGKSLNLLDVLVSCVANLPNNSLRWDQYESIW